MHISYFTFTFACDITRTETPLTHSKVEANFEHKYKYYIGDDGSGGDPQVHLGFYKYFHFYSKSINYITGVCLHLSWTEEFWSIHISP
jgi:hypothetical protein